jgi:hypothetical protein
MVKYLLSAEPKELEHAKSTYRKFYRWFYSLGTRTWLGTSMNRALSFHRLFGTVLWADCIFNKRRRNSSRVSIFDFKTGLSCAHTNEGGEGSEVLRPGGQGCVPPRTIYWSRTRWLKYVFHCMAKMGNSSVMFHV